MKPGWYPIFSLGILVAVVLGIFGIHQSKIFTVKTIICQTDQGACPDYVQAELNTSLGQSLFFTDFYKIGENITRLAPFLARFEISKEFPNTVQIYFFSAQPKYTYRETSGQTWVVDEAGYIIGLADPQNPYPVVLAGSALAFQPEVRERIEPELHQAIVVTLESLKDSQLQESEFTLLSPQEGRLLLPENRVALFNLSNAQVQLAKLAYLLKHFSFESVKEPIDEIDLRFSQIILRNTKHLPANNPASRSATISQ